MPDSVWATIGLRIIAFLYSAVLLFIVLPIAVLVWLAWAVAQLLLVIVTRDKKWTDTRDVFPPAWELFGWIYHNLEYAFFGIQRKPRTTVQVLPDLTG